MCCMKSILLVTVLLATGSAWAADEVADRASIEKVVASLNAFTADFDSRVELAQAMKADPKPTVLISKEPWGEATISIAGIGMTSALVTNHVRLVTPDVAIVDAMGKVPVLVVLRKEGADWKIASLRILAP